MTTQKTLLLLLLVTSTAMAQKDWENPAIFERNQEAAHTPVVPFRSVNAALENDRNSSQNFSSLNGKWQFYWVAVPGEAPEAF